MARVIDISVSLTKGMPVWPGDPPLQIERISDMERGDVCNVSRISFGVHSGTHVDSPLHYIIGATAVDELSLEALIGPAHVFEFASNVREIGPRELESLKWTSDIERVLFKTRNSSFWTQTKQEFQHDFTAFTVAGAEWLSARKGLICLGIDYLSVQLYRETSQETHRLLLKAGLVLIEGLDLSQVSLGRYKLYCLPLKLAGAEGAPARAILVEDH